MRGGSRLYVEKLVVKGYRSLKNIEIDFSPGINVIVGKNNSGKSNIIKALNLIFGEKHPAYITFEDKDFHYDEGGEKAEKNNYRS